MNNVIEMPSAGDFDHDPMSCSLDTEREVRYHTALGKISQIMTDYDWTYSDFCRSVLELDHYYHNWAEINETDIEDEDFAYGATLPSILAPWCFHDFDDEDE